MLTSKKVYFHFSSPIYTRSPKNCILSIWIDPESFLLDTTFLKLEVMEPGMDIYPSTSQEWVRNIIVQKELK